MDSLQAANTIAARMVEVGTQKQVQREEAVQVGLLCAAIAQVEATQAQTEQLKRIADALGNMDANANSIAKAIQSNNQYN